MAAIDLERGLEHSGWGQERPELMDNFDSEMQEWEDQLQDIQRKIEELYNEVQARRGANDVGSDNQKNGGEMNCGLGQNGSLFATDKTHQQYSNSYNGYRYPTTNQNGYDYCHNNGIHEIGDILQDYLGQGKQGGRKNNGARHVHFSDTIKVSSDVPSYLDDAKTKSGSERNGQEQFSGSFVENENKKNRVTQVKSREGSTNKENGGGKPPYKQREAQSRTGGLAESPALERKYFGPGGLVADMKGSPSVLRKFGAMLHENEGKLLTESGVVSPPPQATEPKCPTPSCQRKALGGRMPGRVPTQKCQADCDVQTAEPETSQDRPPATDCGRQNHKDHRGGYSGLKGQPSPQQSQRRAQVQGSPKPRPRAQCGTDKDRSRRIAVHQGEFKMDYTGVNGSPVALRKRSGLRDEGLIELLDMLDIQHEYSSNSTLHTPYRPDTEPDTDVFPAKPQSFSRPARPANQRPPSRWASRAPSARISSPSGPMYRPPSPLTRTPSPLTRPQSPLPIPRNFISYSVHTETVIM